MSERRAREPDWNRVDGVLGREVREELSRRRVAIIGVGSLGSETARLLSMAGIGKFTFIDPDILSPANAVRHVGDLRDVGRFKVGVMRDFIRHGRNPHADIWPVVADAQLQPKLTSACDIAVISGLGSNARQAVIAEELHTRSVTAIVAGVYQKGDGGEVFVIDPHSGPCYSCFSSFLGRQLAEEGIRDRRVVYGVAPDEVEAVPALAIDINRIATIVAGVTLKMLLGESMHSNPKVNLVIYANRRMRLGATPGGQDVYLDPLEAQWFSLPKDRACMVCEQREGTGSVRLADLLEGGEEHG